jgi:hypothetical protein
MDISDLELSEWASLLAIAGIKALLTLFCDSLRNGKFWIAAENLATDRLPTASSRGRYLIEEQCLSIGRVGNGRNFDSRDFNSILRKGKPMHSFPN